MSRPVKKANSKFLKSHEIDEADNVSFIKKGKKKPNAGLSNLQLKEIHPLTENQGHVFEKFKNNNLVLSGYPGVGKSFLALYLALNEIIYGDGGYYKIIIIKSLVKSRECGHLPGSISEKQEPFFGAYYEIFSELFGRGDATEILLKKDIIQFENTSFLRGITFNNSIIIVDEFQNANFQELDTIAGRVGNNTKIIFCGDLNQTDLIYSKNDVSGYSKFVNILKNMSEIDMIEFNSDDIVRSGFVKSYIIEKMKFN